MSVVNTRTRTGQHWRQENLAVEQQVILAVTSLRDIAEKIVVLERFTMLRNTIRARRDTTVTGASVPERLAQNRRH
jgi:hypothetical protein